GVRLMRRSLIIRPSCTGNALSSPNWWRISARICGLGLRPAIRRAGSMPGGLKNSRKTNAVMTKMTSTAHSRRRTMNVSMGASPRDSAAPLSPHPQLGTGVERVPDPVPEHVERQHRQHDHDPGGDGYPRPRVQQARAMAEYGAPAGVGRLHPDPKERQGRLGEDRGGDNQRQQHDHHRYDVRQDVGEE